MHRSIFLWQLWAFDGPKTDLTDLSVDRLVGAGEEEAAYFDPERLRSLQVEA
jgi:hypothetical protein